MLDIIRKKASAWGTKVIFGIIIIVFVFFFGYNRMTKGDRGPKNIVARVDGHVITRPEYNLAYENTLKKYQEIFKNNAGGLPEGVENSVKQSAVNQLVQQAFINKIAKKMDVGPSNLELVETIRSLPVAQDENGQFNPLIYKQRWLPYFQQKYGLDYENLIMNDLTLEHVSEVFALNGEEPFPRISFDVENTKYSFEVTEYPDEASAKAGKDGKVTKSQPVTLAARSTLLKPKDANDAWTKIFSLSVNEKLAEPIAGVDKWYLVKLIKIDKPTDEAWKMEKDAYTKRLAALAGRQSLQSYLQKKFKDVKVKTYLE